MIVLMPMFSITSSPNFLHEFNDYLWEKSTTKIEGSLNNDNEIQECGFGLIPMNKTHPL
jgi:hypothetical protein